MSASIATTSSSRPGSSSPSTYNAPTFWERLWRTSGLQFAGFFIITSVIYGYQPQVGASADALVAFYSGDRTRILIAAALSGLNLLNLLWFAAALRNTLSDAGQDGWGSAATAASATFGALWLLQVTMGAALAYSIASAGNQTLTSGLNDFVWSLAVVRLVPACDVDHVGRVRALASRVYLERAFRGGGRSGRARSSGRHHLAERRILGARRGLYAVLLAHPPSLVGRGREQGSLNPKSRYACWMVIPTLAGASPHRVEGV